MIGLFQTLLLGVASAALCGGIAMSLTRGNALREVIRLASGLAVLLAVLQPLSHVPDVSRRIHCFFVRARLPVSDDALWTLAESAAQGIAADIDRRAAQMGISCTAELQIARDKDGRMVVTGAKMTCPPQAQKQQDALRQMVAAECGIPKELQIWNWISNEYGSK